jgi:hypothetical protein
MSKIKSRLIGSSSALALVALFAFSFVFGTAPVSAQALATPPCSLTSILDNTADVAEELDMLCHFSSTPAESVDVVTIGQQAPIEAEQAASQSTSIAAEDIEPSSLDAASPAAIEGQAIPVEITQTATVAVTGQGEESDITGSVPSAEPVAADADVAPEVRPSE